MANVVEITDFSAKELDIYARCTEVQLDVYKRQELNYAYISSTIVKEVASYGGDISGFVPPLIADQVYDKIASLKDKEGNV